MNENSLVIPTQAVDSLGAQFADFVSENCVPIILVIAVAVFCIYEIIVFV